jgi:hypothetical protein
MEQTNKAIQHGDLADTKAKLGVMLPSLQSLEELLPPLLLNEARKRVVECSRYLVFAKPPNLHVKEPRDG